MRGQFPAAQKFTEFLEKFVRVCVNDYIEGLSLESPDGMGRNVPGAYRSCNLPGIKIVERPVDLQRKLAVQKAYVEALALSGLFALIEGRHDPVGGIQPARKIAQGHPSFSLYQEARKKLLLFSSS